MSSVNCFFTFLWIAIISYAGWYFSDHTIWITVLSGCIATLIRILPIVGLDVVDVGADLLS